IESQDLRVYQILPLDSEREKALKQLSEIATQKRMSVIELIYLAPIEKIRLFSAAFHFRK
ncbi:hypothetical protein, partial [Klebsiella pneumoniae]|uniref:hypothetical protein n=1 Tax=Klebsiella pneumoniae TaxID=573 RepID=UPI001BDFBFDC